MNTVDPASKHLPARLLQAFLLVIFPLITFFVTLNLTTSGLEDTKKIVFKFAPYLPQQGSVASCSDQLVTVCSHIISQGFSYAAVFLAWAIFCLLGLTFAVGTIWKIVPGVMRWWAIGSAAVIGGGLSVFFTIRTFLHLGEPLYQQLGNGVIMTLLNKLPLSHWNSTQWLESSQLIANILAATSSAFITVACAMTADNILHASTQELQQRLEHLRRLMIAGAALLTVGIIQAAQFLAWPKSALLDDKFNHQQSDYQALTDGFLTVQGTGSSMIVLLIYILPAGCIYWRAFTLKSINNQPKSGLNFGLPAGLADVLTVVTPLLAAQLAPLLKVIPIH